MNYIELDPSSLRVPITISADHFPLIRRMAMAFQVRLPCLS